MTEDKFDEKVVAEMRYVYRMARRMAAAEGCSVEEAMRCFEIASGRDNRFSLSVRKEASRPVTRSPSLFGSGE
jgi:hypothetical protein